MTNQVQPREPLDEEAVASFIAGLEQQPRFGNSGPLDLNPLLSILGSLPVLCNENVEAYKATLRHFMASLQPRDFLLQMLVKDLVDAHWEAQRLKRHKAWAIERRDRASYEIEARRIKASEDRSLDKIENERPKADDAERLFHLEVEHDAEANNAIKAVDNLRTPSRDSDLSHAMEQAISLYERLDRLEKDALAKQVIILEQIRLYEEARKLNTQRELDYLNATEKDRLKHVFRELREEQRNG